MLNKPKSFNNEGLLAHIDVTQLWILIIIELHNSEMIKLCNSSLLLIFL